MNRKEHIDLKKAKAIFMAAAVLAVSSCSSIIDSGYIGYKKNEMKYGKGVTIALQQIIAHSRKSETTRISLMGKR